MSKMVPTGSKYTDEQRTEAAIQYAVLGNMKTVAKAIGLPRTTLNDWKKTDWWQELVKDVQTEKNVEQRAKYSRIVDKAQQQTLDKLPDANAAQAHLIACQATDKVRIHDGMPTSISGNMDTRELAEMCKELSRTMRDHRVVSVQSKEKDKDN